MLKNSPWNWHQIGLVAVALVAGLNAPISAQPVDNNEGYTSNEKDSLYGDAPAGLNPLDLIHRSQQLNRRNAAEFGQESEVQLDNSASDFKRLQQQRLLEQQQRSLENSTESTETE